MKTNQEQLIETLKGFIPEEAQTAVAEAVSKFFDKAIAELDSEYDSKLSEAYEEVQKEVQEAEKVGYEGYQKAWGIIKDLKERLEIQKEEYDKVQIEGYEEAWQMIEEEKAKNSNLEMSLYEQYDDKFKGVKGMLVDKIDLFLQKQSDKLEEMVRRQVMSDSSVVENRVAFDKILDIAANCLSDEDFSVATNSKIESLQKQLNETQSQLKFLESKSMRLMMENNKLNESVRKSEKQMLNEQIVNQRNDRKSRIEKAKKVEGRGESEVSRQVVIGEYNNSANETVNNHKNKERDLVEHVGQEVFEDWKRLSGLVNESVEEE